jgi:hypothetical protein
VRVSFVAVLRAFAIVALLVAPALADDQRSIERLVKNHVANLARRPKDDQLALGPNALVIIYGAPDRDPKWSVSDARGGLPGTVAHTAGDATIGVDSDHGVAWFQLPFSVDITPTGAPMGDPALLHTKERFGGIAVLGKDGWRLAVAMYTRATDDAQLEAIALPNGDPKLSGDKGLDNVVAGWVKNGFATHAAADLSLVASGTAAEYQTGDGAKTLAKAFDGLKLRASTIDARTYADGAVGFARARIALPTKTGAAQMLLAVTAVWQEKEWRWVSLQFSATH